MSRFVDMTGVKSGRLTVIARIYKNNLKVHWKCKCECGRIVIRTSGSLSTSIFRKSDSSCHSKECKRPQSKKLGFYYPKEYQIWSNMKERCFNPKDSRYSSYGGRGISISKSWLNFENFFRDMGSKPLKHSIDRIDNNRGYSKENCRWTDGFVQANNTRKNKFLTFKGKKLTISQWSREIGMCRHKLAQRVRAGWPVSRCLAIGQNEEKLK